MQDVFSNLNYLGVLLYSAVMATWHFSLVHFFVSKFLIFMELWLLPESKSQAFPSGDSSLCFCRDMPIPGMGYFTDTVFQTKRNPDLRHLYHCRFVGTPYGSCKIFSGGRRITSMWWESKENLHMGSIFGLPWAQIKSDFNFVNNKMGHFLILVQLQIQLVVNWCQFKQLWEGYLACEIIQPVMDWLVSTVGVDCSSCF